MNRILLRLACLLVLRPLLRLDRAIDLSRRWIRRKADLPPLPPYPPDG